MKLIAPPRREGGNIIVQLDIEDYSRGVSYLQYSVVARLFIQREEVPPTNMNLKARLESAWQFNNFKVILLNGDQSYYYYFFIRSKLCHGHGCD